MSEQELIERNTALASALEDAVICLEEDHNDTRGGGCCLFGECEWARSIRVARELLDVRGARVPRSRGGDK